MTSPTSAKGQRSEQLARSFIERRGYEVIQQNYRCKMGEIDIIALDGDVLCIVEVRSSLSSEHGDPLETITRAKQARLVRATRHYMMTHEPDHQIRFDVVGITYQPRMEITIVQGAFEVDSE